MSQQKRSLIPIHPLQRHRLRMHLQMSQESLTLNKHQTQRRRKRNGRATRSCEISNLVKLHWRFARKVPSWGIHTVAQRVLPWLSALKVDGSHSRGASWRICIRLRCSEIAVLESCFDRRPSTIAFSRVRNHRLRIDPSIHTCIPCYPLAAAEESRIVLVGKLVGDVSFTLLYPYLSIYLGIITI